MAIGWKAVNKHSVSKCGANEEQFAQSPSRLPLFGGGQDEESPIARAE